MTTTLTYQPTWDRPPAISPGLPGEPIELCDDLTSVGVRMSKHDAGRTHDGRTHDGYPERGGTR